MRTPPSTPRTGPAVTAGCAALLLLVTAARLAVENPIEAVGFLYVVPISIAAVEYGWRGGVAAALAALALTHLWVVLQDVSLGLVGYGVRASMFAGLGVLVGLQADQRRRLLAERNLLVEELRDSAMRDQLTGLANRRAWEERFALELERARRAGTPVSVAVVDLDGFKRINDTGGHAEGDRLLRSYAAGFASAIRGTDFIARLGGDEFLVVFPDCWAPEAAQVAERMLLATGDALGASIGIAAWDGCTGEALVTRADRAMYEAKAAGGGRIVLAAAAVGA
jgi:diguanylate cyclase (GGDEF)-like protein